MRFLAAFVVMMGVSRLIGALRQRAVERQSDGPDPDELGQLKKANRLTSITLGLAGAALLAASVWTAVVQLT